MKTKTILSLIVRFVFTLFISEIRAQGNNSDNMVSLEVVPDLSGDMSGNINSEISVSDQEIIDYANQNGLDPNNEKDYDTAKQQLLEEKQNTQNNTSSNEATNEPSSGFGKFIRWVRGE